MNRLSDLRFWLLLFCMFQGALYAGAQALHREQALQFLRENPALYGLQPADVAEIRVTDTYFSKNNGITHVWVQQLHHGIPVHNGLLGLHLTSRGEVLRPAHRFVSSLAQKVNTDLPSLGAARALELAAGHLRLSTAELPGVKQQLDARRLVFHAGAISRKDIPVDAVYCVVPETGAVRLAWSVRIYEPGSPNVWSLRIDAQTGELLEKNNLTLFCAPDALDSPNTVCTPEPEAPLAANNADETYRVYALPVESPAHGVRSYVTNPADPLASPFGWLDTDGVPGAEYTYTRGNNTWAFDDSADDNTGSPAESADGGAGLLFDFPLNLDAEPEQNIKAAVTNLFYTTNMMHDFFYHYGFDEEAGNFQFNNYGNGGAEGDHVLANAIDGNGTNNSNFFTPEDGDNGILQMYKWTRQGGQLLTVNTPAAIDGTYQAGLTNGNWGGPVTPVPLSGDVVLVDDGSAYPYFGCLPPVNNVSGKIALVERGGCSYGEKALKVEQAGALACIICNFEEGPATMGIGAFGGQVTIPVISIGRSDCDKLKQYAGAGLNVSIALPSSPGPEFVDGDFDNGIIAHEYGHGISNRLTGGPSQIECLANLEQMGEGWSDWVTLVTTIKPGDTPETPRGIGTFIRSQPNDGTGFRRYPYSTDMDINPVTYGWVAATSGPTQVHPRGEPWAAACWDLYWALVEKYGYDPDWTNTNSGNGRAIQLVIDGMKLQPCLPGYVDARDALLLADKADFGGADTCLISTVFARRGLGYRTDQGSSFNVTDGTENFDPIPSCVKELKIEKIALNPVVDPGAEAEFLLKITNHKDAAVTGVSVSDELPDGLSLLEASNGGALNNGRVEWILSSLASGQSVELSYRVQTDPDKASVLLFRDNMEDASAASWSADKTEGTETFYLQGQEKYQGDKAWKADAVPTDADMTLEMNQPQTVSGNEPVLRFWHKYNTQKGVDAGFLQIQVDGKWGAVPKDYFFRSPYNGRIQYQNFVIPFLDGFHGNSGGWTQSYVDLGAYAAEDVRFSFRFGTYDNVANGNWVIDAVEMIDLFHYDGEVCVFSNQGDQVCAKAAGRGVVVNPADPSDTEYPADFPLLVQPNPASGFLNIQPGGNAHGPASIRLFGADGRMALQRRLEQFEAGQSFRMELGGLSTGIYLLRVETEQGVAVRKILLR